VPVGSPLDTGWVGLHRFGVDATDGAENPAFRSVWYRVVFPFDGFAAPIANGGLNDLKAGDGVPLKFSLGGAYGLDVVTAVTQQPIDCASREATGSATPAGGSPTYNASLDRYMYVWTSERSWVGGCRSVTLTLSDQTQHRADFRLTK
jgi:hypothetical protein